MITQEPHREITMKTTPNILKTGILGLDLALNGGIPKGSNILLCGPTGTGKTILALQLSHNVIKEGGTVGYLSTEQRVEDLFIQAKAFGWNLERHKKTTFIASDNLPKIQSTMDIFSAPDSEWEYFDVGPDDTKQLDSWTTWFNEELEKRRLKAYDLIIIDSINPFIDNKGREEDERSTREVITRFFSTIGDNQRTSILLVTNLEIPEVESFVDGVIELKDKMIGPIGIQKRIRIKDFRKIKHETNWIPYIISESRGIVLYPPISLNEFYLMEDKNEHRILTAMGGEKSFENPTEKMLFPFSTCLNIPKKGKILVKVNGHHEIRPYLYFVSRQAQKFQAPTRILHQSNFQVLVPRESDDSSNKQLQARAINSLVNQFVTVTKINSLDQLNEQLSSSEDNMLTIIVDFENLLLQHHLSRDERRRILMEFLQRLHNEPAKNDLQLYFVNQHLLEPHEIALLEQFMEDVLEILRLDNLSVLAVKKSLLPTKHHSIHLKWDSS